MARAIRSVLDFTAAEIDWVLDRAARHRRSSERAFLGRGAVVGMAFLEPSLRTRIGFAAAAGRLGASAVEVDALRATAESTAESIEDTIRTMTGYCDAVVARVSGPLIVPDGLQTPLLNGGDRGPGAEHPSQTLIDLFAFGQLAVPWHDQTLALVGDLRMRAARSLLQVLASRPPRRIMLVTEPGLDTELDMAALPLEVDRCALDDLDAVDAVYVVGLPFGAVDEQGRKRLRITGRHLDRLPAHAGVFSPMPVIDEIEREAMRHPRIRVYDQSDDGLFVRMALLELMLDTGPQ